MKRVRKWCCERSVSLKLLVLTLAFVRKAGTIFWTSIGLLILTWRTLPNAWRRASGP